MRALLSLLPFIGLSLAAYDPSNTNYHFESNRLITPQIPRFLVYDNASISHSDGLIHLAPGLPDPHPTGQQLDVQMIPTTYAIDGELVRSAIGYPDHSYYWNYAPTTFGNQTYLLDIPLLLAPGQDSNWTGTGAVFNSSYFYVFPSPLTAGDRLTADGMEFRMLPNGNFLMSAPAIGFMSADSDSSLLWALQGSFQELSGGGSTEKIVFDWFSGQHIGLDESFVTRNSSGSGSSADPYDYFHLTSVDRTPSGNYLVSGRNTNAVYLINGTSAQIIWRLGGKFSNFTLQDLTFSSQNDVRCVNETADGMTISMLNNAFDGDTQTSHYSAGLLISLNYATGVAEVMQSYHATTGVTCESVGCEGYIQSSWGGSMQILSNGNVFIGWGAAPYFSEFLPNGTLVMHAQFGPWTADTWNTTVRSWKVVRGNWTGLPVPGSVGASSCPDIYMQQININEVQFFVSWNGATEVALYQFFVGQTNDPDSLDEFRALDIVPKTGFETTYTAVLEDTYTYGYVTAISRDGRVISRTGAQGIVPLPYTKEIRNAADDSGPLCAATWTPALNSLTCHAMWPGVTEVAMWQFVAGPSNPPMVEYGWLQADSDGAETQFRILDVPDYSYVYVRARDGHGNVIGTSQIVEVVRLLKPRVDTLALSDRGEIPTDRPTLTAVYVPDDNMTYLYAEWKNDSVAAYQFIVGNDNPPKIPMQSFPVIAWILKNPDGLQTIFYYPGSYKYAFCRGGDINWNILATSDVVAVDQGELQKRDCQCPSANCAILSELCFSGGGIDPCKCECYMALCTTATQSEAVKGKRKAVQKLHEMEAFNTKRSCLCPTVDCVAECQQCLSGGSCNQCKDPCCNTTC